MEKRLLQFIGLVIAIVLVWMLWHPLWRLDLNEAVNPKDTEKVTFVIESGQSAQEVAENLDDAGLIVNKKSFLRTLKSEELDSSIRMGQFLLSPSMTLRDVITIVTTQGTGELAVTVIEGWTMQDIDDSLTKLGLIQAGDFLLCMENCKFDYEFLEDIDNLEGFLFPDTYFVESSSFSVEGFANRLLSTFESKLTSDMKAEIDASGRTLEEVVIMASILEKEVNTPTDIPIVSGILWKRLDSDWTLGADATLLYVQEDNIITAEDLQDETPYNTRIYKGLPPTAISNPGFESLKGAIYPEDSEYWFYLTTLDTGEVIYAVTNDEHNANKEEYL